MGRELTEVKWDQETEGDGMTPNSICIYKNALILGSQSVSILLQMDMTDFNEVAEDGLKERTWENFLSVECLLKILIWDLSLIVVSETTSKVLHTGVNVRANFLRLSLSQISSLLFVPRGGLIISGKKFI